MSLNFGYSQQELPESFVGGKMEKDINMDGHNITNLPHPHGQNHAVRKKYVDDELNDKLDLGGGTMTGDLDMDFNNLLNIPVPISSNAVATKFYVDAMVNDCVKRDGTGAMQDDLDLDDNKIINLDEPTADSDAATKNYVDTEISSLPSVCDFFIFSFHSTLNNRWTRAKTQQVNLFWTKERDVKITFFAHVFDDDTSLSNLNLYYKIIKWSKTKVVGVVPFSKLNVAEDAVMRGGQMQMFELNVEKTITDVKCFTIDFKYSHSGHIANESGLHCLVEYI